MCTVWSPPADNLGSLPCIITAHPASGAAGRVVSARCVRRRDPIVEPPLKQPVPDKIQTMGKKHKKHKSEKHGYEGTSTGE